MKIDSNFIKQIFSLKIKLKKKEDKIKLSKYEEEIPMYDIYSKTIYPVKKTDLYSKLIHNHYRFINYEIYDWISDLYKRYDKEDDRFHKNVEIMNNYDIDTLIDTSYKTFYKYSPELGLLVSICKRHSFSPFIKHLNPYYTKLELVKLGQNMKLNTNVELEKLVDKEGQHKGGYKDFCMKVSDNDVSFKNIKKFCDYIHNSNVISWICFYSFTGSFLFNKYLRNMNVETINSELYDGLHKIVDCMKNAPALEKGYEMYRFIWDDSFLLKLKEGDIFTDKGFVSTTRDPFYSPGLNGDFGLILLKIKVPPKQGLGLFVENYSLFPKEEEFLLAPYSRIKLISKNENFKYYHTNADFERLIDRKYEFELIDIDYKLFYKENPISKIKEDDLENFDIRSINLEGNDRIDIIKKFIAQYTTNNKVNLSGYTFSYNWFDSSTGSAYEKFYYNKTKDGIIFTLMDEDGYPYLNIELGKVLAINYLNTFYFGRFCSNTENYMCYKIKEKEFLDLIYHFGRIFYYKKAFIFHTYCSFEEFKKNFKESDKIFLTMNLFNKTIYNYLKHGKKQFEDNSFISYDTGYWYLDEYFNKKSEDENYKTNKDLFINLVEEKFYNYSKTIETLDKNIFKNSYFTFNIYDKLLSEGLGSNFKPNIGYSKEGDENFRLIYRQPIRRV